MSLACICPDQSRDEVPISRGTISGNNQRFLGVISACESIAPRL